jgi:hypothetical protein
VTARPKSRAESSGVVTTRPAAGPQAAHRDRRRRGGRRRGCVRPRIPGHCGPGGLGPHHAAPGFPGGLSSGLPFARPDPSPSPAAGWCPSPRRAPARSLRPLPGPVPLRRPARIAFPGSTDASAATGRVRRRRSRAARTKVAGPCLLCHPVPRFARPDRPVTGQRPGASRAPAGCGRRGRHENRDRDNPSAGTPRTRRLQRPVRGRIGWVGVAAGIARWRRRSTGGGCQVPPGYMAGRSVSPVPCAFASGWVRSGRGYACWFAQVRRFCGHGPGRDRRCA